MSLRIVPITRDQATAFIAVWHRHHGRPQGYRFALAVADDDTIVGVATVGRPVGRHLDNGMTVEVTRLATDGTWNACSALYGACWRAAKAMGYQRAITYTLDSETGASLRAAGWTRAAQRRPRRGWDTPTRPRSNDGYLPSGRWLWQITSSSTTEPPTRISTPPTADSTPALFDLIRP